MINLNEHIKAITFIKICIKKLELNLQGYEVLTEVGSNNYLYTPLIALLAGAKKVNAWTKDTKYGYAKNIINECLALKKHFAIEGLIEFYDEVEPNIGHLQSADIITNSGFLRPLNSSKLKNCKSSVVIPLMYEEWELRNEDIDIQYCKNSNIKVAGTWENHPLIGVFNSIKHLSIKLALEAGYEVYQNKIIVWSDDNFGQMAKVGFEEFGATEVILTNNYNELLQKIENVDFIFICDYSESKTYLSESNEFYNLSDMQKKNESFGLVHLYGNINYEAYHSQINIYPKKNGYVSTMSETLGYLGIKPIINLQTAGFKVAQEMLDGNLTSLSQPIVL